MKKSLLIRGVFAAVFVSALCGFIYLEIQQSQRQSANDPQIQMAEDAADALAAGARLQFSQERIDVARSLAPYLIIFDAAGSATSSNAVLDGKMPQLPKGVLEYADAHGENRVTWQPRPGVRSAIVVVPIRSKTGGFVAAGRSLREIENREQQSLDIILAAWAGLLILCWGTLYLLEQKEA